MKRQSAAAIAVTALGMLCACANDHAYDPVPGQKMPITQGVLDGFKEYQGQIGSTHPGVFAVSEAGRYYYYWYCNDVECLENSTFGQRALSGCSSNSGEKCYIFAKDNDIKVDYVVVP